MASDRTDNSRAAEVQPIALVISGDQWAGAAVQVYNTIDALKRNGFNNIKVLVFNGGELKERLDDLGVEVYLLDEGKLSGISLIKGLIKFIRDESPCLLHLHEYKVQVLTTVAVVLSGFKGPVLRTVHSRLTMPVGNDEKRMRFFQYLDRFSIRIFTAGVIAVSQEISDSLAAASIRTPSWTIPNAVTLCEPGPVADCARIRDRFDIPARAMWIGSAIRLEPIKNPVLLLRMASVLKDRQVSFFLSIFGDGSLKSTLQSEIERLELQDCVVLHGHSTDVSKIMCGWDIFVLTSLHEGLPMSLLEAMSVGVVPVCTRVGGIPEAVEDGQNGFLIPSDDEFALSDAVQRLILEEPTRNRLGKNAALLIRKKYDAMDMAKKYIEVYRILLGKDVPAWLEASNTCSI